MVDPYSVGKSSRRTAGKAALVLAAHVAFSCSRAVAADEGGSIAKPYDSPFGTIEIAVVDKVDVAPTLSFIYRNLSGAAQDCLLPRPRPELLLEWLKIWISSNDGTTTINSLTRTKYVRAVVGRDWIAVPVNGLIGTEVPLFNQDKNNLARFDARVPRGKVRIQAVVSDVFFASENRSKAPQGNGLINGDKTFPPDVRKWSKRNEVMRSNILEVEN